MKKYIIILFPLIFLILGFVLMNCLFLNKNNNGDKEFIENVTNDSNKKNENEDIIKLIYEKGKILNYFEQNNLESFEIIDVIPFGYFKSKSNIRYYQINYDFTCKDGTRACNLLDELIDIKENLFTFKIALDLNNKDYIEINPEFTIHFNSDWIAT